MKSFKIASLTAAALLLSSVANASDMMIDVGTNDYDLYILPGPSIGPVDANTITGAFTQFGFDDIWTTSVYDFDDETLLGKFFDTNITSILTDLNIPTSGTALDTVTTVNLEMPDCTTQCDIDTLSGLTPPQPADAEGFVNTWDLQVEYLFNGIFTPSGPVFTDGFMNIIFNDKYNDDNDRIVLTAEINGFNIEFANFNLFFDITYAETGFLWIDNGSGTFIDAADGVASGEYAQFRLDANIDKATPTPDQLLKVTDVYGKDWAIRQTSLDGSITASIPEPASLTMLGLGLLGLAAAGRRQRKN